MSVLKSKRTESKAEYVNVANAIYIETINFLTRISARYSRLIAEPVAKLAGEVIDHAEKANSIYPSDDQRRQLRKAHLLEARASLMALDVRLTHCYLIMTQNPQGCFTTPSGKSVDAKKATELRYAESFQKDSVHMINGDDIPVSRSMKNNLDHAIMEKMRCGG